MIYLCETCGKWGGLALAIEQPLKNLARALKGEQVGLVDPEKVFCPECDTAMRQVRESDRLAIRLHAIDSRIADDGMGGHLETTD